MMQTIAPITDFPTTMINDWIFDLDNTIYPARTNLFLRVAVRITEFVAKHYRVSHDEARVIQKDLFQRYGTTMRGMMIEEANDRCATRQKTYFYKRHCPACGKCLECVWHSSSF